MLAAPLAGKIYSERNRFASSSYQNTFYNRQLITPFKSWQSRHFHAMPPGVSHFIILGIVCGAICSDKSGARVFYSLHTSSTRRCMGLLWNIEHLNLLLYQRRHMETRPKRSGFIILNFIQAKVMHKTCLYHFTQLLVKKLSSPHTCFMYVLQTLISIYAGAIEINIGNCVGQWLINKENVF